MPYWLYNNDGENLADGPYDNESLARQSRLGKDSPFAWKIVPHGARSQREFMDQYTAARNKDAAGKQVLGVAGTFLRGLVVNDPNAKIHPSAHRNNRMPRNFKVIEGTPSGNSDEKTKER